MEGKGSQRISAEVPRDKIRFGGWFTVVWASLVAKRIKHLPAMRETQVQSLGQEDPLEKEMATHSSTLAWRIPWTEEPGRLQSMGSQRVGHNRATSVSSFLSFFLYCCLDDLNENGGRKSRMKAKKKKIY